LIPVKNPTLQIDRAAVQLGRSPSVRLRHYREDGIRVDFSPAEGTRFDRIDGQRTIQEIEAATPTATRAFWRKLYDLDLVWFRKTPGSSAPAAVSQTPR